MTKSEGIFHDKPAMYRLRCGNTLTIKRHCKDAYDPKVTYFKVTSVDELPFARTGDQIGTALNQQVQITVSSKAIPGLIKILTDLEQAHNASLVGEAQAQGDEVA